MLIGTNRQIIAAITISPKIITYPLVMTRRCSFSLLASTRNLNRACSICNVHKGTINERIVVVTKSNCPYCASVVALVIIGVVNKLIIRGRKVPNAIINVFLTNVFSLDIISPYFIFPIITKP